MMHASEITSELMPNSTMEEQEEEEESIEDIEEERVRASELSLRVIHCMLSSHVATEVHQEED